MLRSYAPPLAVFLFALGALGVVLAAFATHRWRHLGRLSRIPIRIHVAGTRGKSATVRLIAAGLRAGGHRVVAKTTGTAPRLILPDGSEQAWGRHAPASIREQARFIRRAAALEAGAIVVECMAIRPELIDSSQRHFVRATDAVVTNIRPDHAEDLNAAVPAGGLLPIVPMHGRLFLGDEIDAAPFATLAEHRDSTLAIVPVHSLPPEEANLQMAIAVCGAHGVAAAATGRAAAAALTDPGAYAAHRHGVDGKVIAFHAAFACNDVESFDRLWRRHAPQAPRVVLFNARRDRPLRSRAFFAYLAALQPSVELFVAGGGWFAIRLARRSGFPSARLRRVGDRDPEAVLAQLAAAAGDDGEVWGIGNYKGLGEAISRRLSRASTPC